MFCTLANGTTWRFSASDRAASNAVAKLAATMQLKRRIRPILTRGVVDVEIGTHARNGTHSAPGHAERWTLRHFTNQDQENLRLMQISAHLGASALEHNGVLLHGAMVENSGRGVVLAGPSGIGKSTASRRLPAPWRARSDDQTLVVHDDDAHFWAHPWPTWSAFLWGGPGGTWEVERAAPLAAIFFLEQSAADSVRSIGQGEAACMAIATVEQAALNHLLVEPGLDLKHLRLARLAAVDVLVRQVPCFVLRVSLTGSFWTLIEEVLGMQQGGVR